MGGRKGGEGRGGGKVDGYTRDEASGSIAVALDSGRRGPGLGDGVVRADEAEELIRYHERFCPSYVAVPASSSWTLGVNTTRPCL